ncbi:MAG: hypothetical protein D6701_03855, partial [Gemmatimonadetes bacterium]
LRGTLELARDVPEGTSAALAERAQRHVLGALTGPELEVAGGLAERVARWTRRGTAALAASAVLAAAVLAFAPSRATQAWAGLARPVHHLRAAALPPLEVRPGDARVRRGDPFELVVSAPGRTTVTVRWRAAGDVPRTAVLSVDEAGEARWTVEAVDGPFRYDVSAPDGARSPTYSVTPVDPLLVADVTVELAFPPHTGRLPEEYRGDVPPLDVPVGTRLSVRGVASRPLATAALVHGPAAADAEEAPPARSDTVVLGVEAAAFSGTFTPTRAGRYGWRFTDLDGGEAAVVPPPIELSLVPDRPPTVALRVPGRDTVLTAGRTLPLVIETADDYGLDRLEVVLTRVAPDGTEGEPVRQALDLEGTRGALVRPVLDFGPWELVPGERVRYHARVLDNAPDPQEARTPTFEVRVPTLARVRNETRQRLEEAMARLEELQSQSEEQADAIRNRQRQLDAERRAAERGSGDPSDERAEFERREEVERALDRQDDMLERVDSLRAEMARMQEDLDRSGLADPELRQTLEALERLLDEVAPETLRQRLEALRGGLEEMDDSALRESLREMGEDEESLRDRLEEALDRFQQAAREQSFRAAAQEADELSRQQRALAEALADTSLTEAGEAPRRAGQQEALGERAEALGERLEELETALTEAGELEERQAVAGAREDLEQARRRMDEAARQARDGRRSEAASRGRQAAERLEQVAEELADARGRSAEEALQAMQQALERTASEAVSLARRQSELREQMRGAGQETLGELRGEEQPLLEGARQMADQLSVAGRMTGADTRDVQTGLGEAMEAMARTLAALSDPGGRLPSPVASSETAAEALNRAALEALRSARALQNGAQGGGEGEGQVGEQLQELAQQQGALNNRTSQLMPMQLGEQAEGQQLSELAQGQRSIASNLGDLANEPGAGESLGDLEALAEEARALAEALEGGRLEPETIRRQDRLFHRLLDAGRSLEKEEESEERESEAPGAFERADVLPLGPDALGALRLAGPDAEALRRLTPAERLIVLRYFERLNRERRLREPPPPGGGGGGR